ncbi:MAG: hypothetical protein ACTSYB_11940 [Candidatus Helarchaeota archaeon]
MPELREKLNALTTDILKKLCKTFKMKGYSNKRKQPLISLIIQQAEHQPELKKLIDDEYVKKIHKVKKATSQKPVIAKVSKSSSDVKVTGSGESIIIKLSQTINQLIAYTNEQFKKINVTLGEFNLRLQKLEQISKIQSLRDKERNKIRINAENLLKIIKTLSQKKKGGYLTFHELRKYIMETYIVENVNWEHYLELLRANGKIEFSKGAKTTPYDKGYKDAFNRTYYYFKLK